MVASWPCPGAAAEGLGRRARRQRAALEEIATVQATVLERVAALLEGSPPGAAP